MSELSKEELIERAVEQCRDWNNRLYVEGYKKAQRDFGQELRDKDETTTLSKARPEQVEDWRDYGLAVFCDKCKIGLTDHWAFFNYCPFCGRRIVRENR